MIQVAIVTILMFVLMFGIGFILNMLLKTTWLPLYLYILLVIGIIIWFWTKENSEIWTTLWGMPFPDFSLLWATFKEFAFPDYAAAIGGLIGAWLTGWSIQMLRIKGYKMF